MLWPIVGFPLTTMATPVFFGEELPEVITTNTPEAPFLPAASLKLKQELFPVKNDDHKNYIDVAKLKNRKKTGYQQILMDAEKKIIDKVKNIDSNSDKEVIKEYYNWLDHYVFEVYEKLLPDEKIKCDLPRCGDEKVCE